MIICMLMLGLANCNDDEHNNSASIYKITINLTNVNAGEDYVSVTAAGSNRSAIVIGPLWRLNGIEQPSTQVISLDKDDFTGSVRTYQIETVTPIEILAVGVQIINYGPLLEGSIKIEKGNTIVINEAIGLDGDNSDFTEDYSFN